MPSLPPRSRDIFCNRTLNLRAIKAIGYDMDYTLVHYKVDAWELRAYEYTQKQFVADGWPIGEARFEPELVSRGIIIDTELGNLVKANRFGYVKRAVHGTRMLGFDEQRQVYGRTMVDLANPRWIFLNTLFSLSEACLYAQAVELLDARLIPEVLSYQTLFKRIRDVLDAAHMEGTLKSEIVANPDRYVLIDPEMPLALLDQKAAGKKLLLITNSEWEYTRSMLRYAIDPFLSNGMKWESLFDVVILEAHKPEFFLSKMPLFEVVNEEGLLKPSVAGIRDGTVFLGGHAGQVEKHLGLSGDEILYVGDHMWGDVHASKSALRWRTALVLRELEAEIESLERFAPKQRKLDELMAEKEQLESELCIARLLLQRKRQEYGPPVDASGESLEKEAMALRETIEKLDVRIQPLALEAGKVGHPFWGPLMRAGNDKSHLARQVEGYADIYTSRVSNFLYRTPSRYFRSPKGSLPHDP